MLPTAPTTPGSSLELTFFETFLDLVDILDSHDQLVKALRLATLIYTDDTDLEVIHEQIAITRRRIMGKRNIGEKRSYSSLRSKLFL